MAINIEKSAFIYKALSDPTRLQILKYIGEGEKCNCFFVDKLGMAQPAVSYHTNILYKAGLINRHKDGRWTHFSINEAGCKKVSDFINTIANLPKS